MIHSTFIFGLIAIAAGLALAYTTKIRNSRQARKVEVRLTRREHTRK